MNVKSFSLCVAFVFSCGFCCGEDWSRFRGPNGSGIVDAIVPASWSDESNIAWSIDLPGAGSSSPIVIGDNVLVTCYSGYGVPGEEVGAPESLTRKLMCFNRKDGSLVFETSEVAAEVEDDYQGFIKEHGYASSTPVSDGQHIYVVYGKSGLYCYDMKGEKVWHQPLGTFSDPAKWGDGASPILHNDLVIVNAGIVGHAIVALNKESGEEVWRTENEKFTNCWSTPVKVEANGRTELVFSMPGQIVSLNPDDGSEYWTCVSPIAQTVTASLASEGDVVYAMGGRGGVAVAVRCGGSGDVSETHKLWETRLRAGIGTPIVVSNRLYWTVGGEIYCANCETGDQIYQEKANAEEQTPEAEGENAGGGRRRRGPAGDYASPVCCGDRIYMVMRNGTTHVVKPKESFELVSSNKLGDGTVLFNASPAISDNQMYIRSDKKLYCISQ
ncbi:MAG: PQQ-binding-like beta-propeller repeat protein [Pirellulaceae bacterium]